MAEMLITSPEIKKVIENYDFTLGTGLILPVTIDPTLGDSIEFTEGEVRVKISPKPELGDPERLSGGEEITIFTKHLVSIHKRYVEVVELSPEQKFEQQQFIHEMAKAVQ